MVNAGWINGTPDWSLINEKGKLKSQGCYLLQFKLRAWYEKLGPKLQTKILLIDFSFSCHSLGELIWILLSLCCFNVIFNP